jgi:hypothetical protein
MATAQVGTEEHEHGQATFYIYHNEASTSLNCLRNVDLVRGPKRVCGSGTGSTIDSTDLVEVVVEHERGQATYHTSHDGASTSLHC